MLAALVIVASTAAGLVGLAAFLVYRWNASVNRALNRSDDLHEADLNYTTLRLQYEESLRVLKDKKAEAVRLAAALKESDAAYREQVELSIQDPAAPGTADALRLALRRLERLRDMEVPEASEATSPESGEGDGDVHGSDSGASSES